MDSSTLRAEKGGRKSHKVISAIFIDGTVYGSLLKQMRSQEANLSTLTGYKVKVVEKNGVTLGQALA